jgi:hypothetical protein
MFDPSVEDDRRFHDYFNRRIPDPTDSIVEAYVQTAQRDGPPVGEAKASEFGRQVLALFAGRQAAVAARRREPDRLVVGLVALTLAGLPRYDQTALMMMPLIEHSALLIGLDPADIFEVAAAKIGHPGSVALMRWLARPGWNRTLESMGFAETRDDDGVRYRSTLRDT